MKTTCSFQLAPGRASLAEIMDRTAHQLAQLRPADEVVVVVAPADKRLADENAQLKAELAALKQAEADRQQAAIVRAHRLDRLNKATRCIIDHCDPPTGPLVVVTMREVFLAEHQR